MENNPFKIGSFLSYWPAAPPLASFELVWPLFPATGFVFCENDIALAQVVKPFSHFFLLVPAIWSPWNRSRVFRRHSKEAQATPVSSCSSTSGNLFHHPWQPQQKALEPCMWSKHGSSHFHALRFMLILQLCRELFSHMDPAVPKSGSIPHLEVALQAFTAQRRRLWARMEDSGLFSLTSPFTWCQFC